MNDLILHLQEAMGPDRYLDALIYLATDDRAEGIRDWHPRHDFRDTDHTFSFVVDDAYPEEDDIQLEGVLPYTASIDAALTLVPEGMEWSVSNRGQIGAKHLSFVGVYGEPMVGSECDTNATTPAIALCIAALKARDALKRATDVRKTIETS